MQVHKVWLSVSIQVCLVLTDHTKRARSQVRGEVVNYTIPKKKQRTHYPWCEGWWPIRRVIGKPPLSSAMNMTRAEALRNDSI